MPSRPVSDPTPRQRVQASSISNLIPEENARRKRLLAKRASQPPLQSVDKESVSLLTFTASLSARLLSHSHMCYVFITDVSGNPTGVSHGATMGALETGMRALAYVRCSKPVMCMPLRHTCCRSGGTQRAGGFEGPCAQEGQACGAAAGG